MTHARWTWDLNRIHAKGYTDNVVDLMVGKLNRLPAETQKALQQLACLGNSAGDQRCFRLFSGPREEVHWLDLWEAVRQEFVERLEGSYKFVHDRVQEAAYSLIPEAVRAEAHLRIGRLLAAHTPARETRRGDLRHRQSAQPRRAPDHIARGARAAGRAQLMAGKRAKMSTAYASALEYLVAGCELLPEDSWERRYPLTFALEFQQAECEFLTGDFAAAEERLSMLSGRASGPGRQCRRYTPARGTLHHLGSDRPCCRGGPRIPPAHRRRLVAAPDEGRSAAGI